MRQRCDGGSVRVRTALPLPLNPHVQEKRSAGGGPRSRAKGQGLVFSKSSLLLLTDAECQGGTDSDGVDM